MKNACVLTVTVTLLLFGFQGGHAQSQVLYSAPVSTVVTDSDLVTTAEKLGGGLFLTRGDDMIGLSGASAKSAVNWVPLKGGAPCPHRSALG